MFKKLLHLKHCERIFGIRGDLYAGKRSRMSVNLERHVIIKLKNILAKLICWLPTQW